MLSVVKKFKHQEFLKPHRRIRVPTEGGDNPTVAVPGNWNDVRASA